MTRELAALVGVEDFRFAVTRNRLAYCIKTEVGRHRIGEAPGQDLSAVPVDHCDQINEAPAHRDVGDVRGPDLVGAARGHLCWPA